ncbi:hypothetical protein Q5424_28520 [Conexibacter sp. JD483]|uniref:hypothetical protein n=1 Tax=unclassified Conexibacter TaxID=2627773 RepID=UPI00271A4E27|nr:MULTISPECIES: hypothetical protein [unclassified Conexibacter]MDO8189568.1 hypothetical protein [Conexibacter sp. CPCC 205706]MDO8196500.1 hypothetical protein [Conexibacter sp. CPCC 205762]MDR9373076.1 hypothetical protein [Conexibacter sp. JD483]
MSSWNGARGARTLLTAALAASACAIAAPSALAANVTVRVEGRSGTLLSQTTVTIGDGTRTAHTWNNVGSLPYRCADDTAYQATELALRGNWDKQTYVETLAGESHTWSPNSEYWILYDNNNYADWGGCDLHLADGDTVLWQAGVSGASPDFIPDSIPVFLNRVTPATGSVRLGRTLTVRLTAYRPTDIFGTQDPNDPNHWIIPPSPATNPAGYTVSIGGATAVTNSSGEATVTVPSTRGVYDVQASVPGSSTNWSRSIPIPICVSNTTC